MSTHFTLAFLTLAATAALGSPSTAQCDQSQGNVALGVSGLPQAGSTLRVAVTGEAGARFAVAADTTTGSANLFGGTICLGSNPRVLINGFTNPLYRLSALGEFHLDLTLPNLPVGTRIYFQSVATDPASPLGTGLAISNLVQIEVIDAFPVTTVFFEDFEAGWGNWWASNGVWQVGAPTVGPASAYSGTHVGGTVLDGNYPDNASSYLVSPPIGLPALGAAEQIRMTYRIWFVTQPDYDSGRVYVRKVGEAWEAPSCNPIFEGYSGGWTQSGVDLSAYAGETIEIAFYFYSNSGGNFTGVYLDDVHVFRGTPALNDPETWEDGIGFWWTAGNGLWQVGEPSSGPASVPSGTKLLGTRLDGDYSDYANSRFVGPRVTVPATGSPRLYFSSWTNTQVSYDYGLVQISVDGGCTWASLTGAFTGLSNGWGQASAD
ncbi:MAG TPA: choice-of-anchor J domain-containing protein, partial [Planctomycetota bacterium]